MSCIEYGNIKHLPDEEAMIEALNSDNIQIYRKGLDIVMQPAPEKYIDAVSPSKEMQKVPLKDVLMG